MLKNHYFIERYVQCGEMPLFLIFYRDRRGAHSHCAMLCTYKNLRLLLRQRKGFSAPEQYGRVLYASHTEKPNDAFRYMLKERYGFDFEAYENNLTTAL
jgi:hypothetical protein